MRRCVRTRSSPGWSDVTCDGEGLWSGALATFLCRKLTHSALLGKLRKLRDGAVACCLTLTFELFRRIIMPVPRMGRG